VKLFFSDERCVPPTAPESNYGMARDSFISFLNIPQANVHRMKGESDPAVAAKEYEREIRTAFGGQPVRFDLIILGIGEDGHTASIFPGSPVIEEKRALVCPALAPDQKMKRLTLTLPCLNSAREIIFLASGKKKAGVVQRVFGTAKPLKELPATMVRPVEGKIHWYLDKEAASELEPGADSKQRPF
jgi:6-phosphogluconolactonase